MTIIIAAVGPREVVLAADSLRSAPDGHSRHVEKIKRLSYRVVVAKGGYGDLADGIWTALKSLPARERASPSLVADAIQRLAQPIYESCKATATAASIPDLGLYFVVAGIEQDGRAVAITIDLGEGVRFSHRSHKGMVALGLGSVSEAHTIALETANAIGDPLDPKSWTAAAVHAASAIDPKTIGFPAYGRIVTVNRSEEFTVMGLGS